MYDGIEKGSGAWVRSGVLCCPPRKCAREVFLVAERRNWQRRLSMKSAAHLCMLWRRCLRKEDGKRVTSMGSVARRAFEPSSMSALRAAFTAFARRSRSTATCVWVRSMVWKCARGP